MPRGAGKGRQQDGWIAAEWDRLELFDRDFSGDGLRRPGPRAQAQIIERLEAGNGALSSTSPHTRMPNDAHKAGVNLQDIISKARTCDPEELRCAADFLGDIADYFDKGTMLEGNAP